MATGTQYRDWVRWTLKPSASHKPPHWEKVRDRGSWLALTQMDRAGSDTTRDDMPTSIYAAYQSIWDSMHFDPVAAGGTLYDQACYSTGSGTVSMTDTLIFGKALSFTGTGTVSLADTLAFNKTLAATGTGTVSMGKHISKTFAAVGSGLASVVKSIALGPKAFSGTGSASLAKGLVMTQTAYSTGSGTASMFKRIGKIFSAAGNGVASILATFIPGAGATPGTSRIPARPVYVLPSVVGLKQWIDYIPVKQKAAIRDTSFDTYNDDGNLNSQALTSVVGLKAWIDYIPVFESSGPEAKRWRYDDDGWISLSDTYPD